MIPVATVSVDELKLMQGWWDATCVRNEEYGVEDDPDDVALANRLGLTTLTQEQRL